MRKLTLRSSLSILIRIGSIYPISYLISIVIVFKDSSIAD